MDFTAVPDTLRASGSTAAAAVQALHGADCWRPVNGVSAALPCSASASAAHSYVSAWTVYFTGWCAQATQHAAALSASAQTYATTEHHNTQALTTASAPSADDSGIFDPGFNEITKALG